MIQHQQNAEFKCWFTFICFHALTVSPAKCWKYCFSELEFPRTTHAWKSRYVLRRSFWKERWFSPPVSSEPTQSSCGGFRSQAVSVSRRT